tara:strand:- start:1984 stop:2514 length:531 start_codon:yes stop_codon:yes gene_type:complete
MGSKPKPQQYKPSETEKQQARQAEADQAFFESTYDPLLRKMRDESLRTNTEATLRGRAQADTMQTLTGKPTLGAVSSVDTAATRASGAVANMLQANVLAKDVKNQQQVGVLATARGQQADAGSGLAQAAKLARSEGLNRATAALSRSTNIMSNIGRVGGAVLKKGMDDRGFFRRPA